MRYSQDLTFVIMKHAVILGLLIFNCMLLRANDPVRPVSVLQGEVIDMGNSENLSGVRVSIAGSNLVTYTDRDGKFIFENLPLGEITLEFSLVSFDKKYEQISLQSPASSLVVEMKERD